MASRVPPDSGIFTGWFSLRPQCTASLTTGTDNHTKDGSTALVRTRKVPLENAGAGAPRTLIIFFCQKAQIDGPTCALTCSPRDEGSSKATALDLTESLIEATENVVSDMTRTGKCAKNKEC